MASSDREPDDTGYTLSPPSTDDASSYGLTLTIVGAVLLAFAYYGYLAIQAQRQIGQAIPEPFYVLAVSVLFVLEILARRTLNAVVVARAIALTAVYGTLFVFAVEGGVYLWEEPSVALEGYVGVSVFAVSLIVATLVYVGYLTILESDT